MNRKKLPKGCVIFMYKIAVVGDNESIYGYASLGLTVCPTDAQNARETVENLVKKQYAVIYITENIAESLTEVIEKYRSEYLPAIIQIPAIKGNTGAGMADVHKSVEKAVGSDILSKRNEDNGK